MGEIIMLFAQFGACGDKKGPDDAEPAKVHVLYLANNKKGCRGLRYAHPETQKRLGIHFSAAYAIKKCRLIFTPRTPRADKPRPQREYLPASRNARDEADAYW